MKRNQKKSESYYRFIQDQAAGKFSYYDGQEIEVALTDLLDEGNVKDACILMEMAIKQHPDDEEITKLAVWVFILAGRVEEAERMFQPYANDQSDLSERIRFCLQVSHGHVKEALDAFTKTLIEERCDLTPLYWVLGVEDMFDRIPHNMLPTYLDTVGHLNSGHDAESYARIAAMLMDCGSHEMAIKYLDQSLDFDAYDIYSWMDLAKCHYLLGNLDRCAEACDYGLAIEPNNAMLHFAHGSILYYNNDFTAAISHLEVVRKYVEGVKSDSEIETTALELMEQEQCILEMLGFSYLNCDRVDESCECFDVLVARQPGDTLRHLQVASAYVSKGDLNTACQHTEIAVKLEPKNTDARALLISVYTAMHRFDEALTQLKLVIELKPKSKNYLLAFAELSKQVGRNEEADWAYRRLLDLKPRDKASRMLLRAYFASIGDEEALSRIK
ncbi:MAG: tetratricopeptide repeat protein [Bacteroidales bacterium]|nr:tetratricopeptide repeat protein [Candidatus Liminaster caballi]